jgi:hypothetical protein
MSDDEKEEDRAIDGEEGTAKAWDRRHEVL